MKLKLSELNPNPYKKEIDAGELDEDNIKKLMSNLNELGMMGALPIVQISKKYHLVYGHHRVEALKRVFGIDYQVDVKLHDYSEDQLLRGMVIENLTQRDNEFKQEMFNLLAIRKHLKEHPAQTLSDQANRKDIKGVCDAGSSKDISNWLDKNSGSVMKMTKIKDILRIADNLNKELLEEVKKQSHATGEKEEDDKTIGVKVATALSSFKDEQEQKDLSNAIKQSRDQHGNKVRKNLTHYKKAPDEIKQKVRQGTLDIADIEDETLKEELTEKAKERPKTVFIANFAERMRQFNANVTKLEKQIKIFSDVFHSPQFVDRYNVLKPKAKQKFNMAIFSIRDRLGNCFDEVEYFMDQLPEDVVLLEVKQ